MRPSFQASFLKFQSLIISGILIFSTSNSFGWEGQQTKHDKQSSRGSVERATQDNARPVGGGLPRGRYVNSRPVSSSANPDSGSDQQPTTAASSSGQTDTRAAQNPDAVDKAISQIQGIKNFIVEAITPGSSIGNEVGNSNPTRNEGNQPRQSAIRKTRTKRIASLKTRRNNVASRAIARKEGRIRQAVNYISKSGSAGDNARIIGRSGTQTFVQIPQGASVRVKGRIYTATANNPVVLQYSGGARKVTTQPRRVLTGQTGLATAARITNSGNLLLSSQESGPAPAASNQPARTQPSESSAPTPPTNGGTPPTTTGTETTVSRGGESTQRTISLPERLTVIQTGRPTRDWLHEGIDPPR